MNKAGVPCGPINTIDQTFAEPQVQHLGIARPVKHPKLGDIKVVGQPINLSDVAAAQGAEARRPTSASTPTRCWRASATTARRSLPSSQRRHLMAAARKAALITGAGRNIGRACVLGLAEDGFNVVINGSSDRAACESVAKEAAEARRRGAGDHGRRRQARGLQAHRRRGDRGVRRGRCAAEQRSASAQQAVPRDERGRMAARHRRRPRRRGVAVRAPACPAWCRRAGAASSTSPA